MKRHPSLQPLSRDHNASLVLARHLERDPCSTRLKEFLDIWDDEMDDHLFEEERILLNFATPEQSARLINDHMTVRQYAGAARRGMLAQSDIVRLGALLHAHIRWEERSLFPSIEAAATDEDLAAIAVETTKLEERRKDSPHAPRRGELMSRRP